MKTSKIFVATFPGFSNPALAIAACRAGAVGIIDCEYALDKPSVFKAVDRLCSLTDKPFGVKLSAADSLLIDSLLKQKYSNLLWFFLTPPFPDDLARIVQKIHGTEGQVFFECLSVNEIPLAEYASADGVIIKGNEAGGRVAAQSSFILFQTFLRKTTLPIIVQGGMGLYTAPACLALGAEGILLDSQCALLRESPVPDAIKKRLASFDGTETVCLHVKDDCFFRVIKRLNQPLVQKLSKDIEEFCLHGTKKTCPPADYLRKRIMADIQQPDAEKKIWILGQDIGLAAHFASQYVTVGGVVKAISSSLENLSGQMQNENMLMADSPMALSHGTQYPIVQGPMARISDSPQFADEVVKNGALPFLATER